MIEITRERGILIDRVLSYIDSKGIEGVSKRCIFDRFNKLTNELFDIIRFLTSVSFSERYGILYYYINSESEA